MTFFLRAVHAIICTSFLLTRTICMQDWLEQIAFVCFVSLYEEDDERELAQTGERGEDLEGCE